MLLWLPFVLRNHRLGTRVGGNVWKDALEPAAVNVVAQTCWAVAPYYNDASVIGFMFRMTFLFSAVIGYVLLHEERAFVRHPVFAAGSLGVIAGVLLMYQGGLAGAGTSPAGLAIMIWTAVCWAMYGVSVQRKMQAYPARLSFGVISIYTCGALVFLMFLFGKPSDLSTVPGREVMLLTVSGVLGIGIGHVLLYRAIRILGPVMTQSAFSVMPFIGALIAYLVLGEVLTPAQWLGGLIVVGSCAVMLWLKKHLSEAR
jgi:drug/metabolite transporter (DMT)-like permease